MDVGSAPACWKNATWAVGSLRAGNSPHGLKDIAGNVAEWTRHAYSAYSAVEQTDPLGPGLGPGWVIRGCGFASNAGGLRAGSRHFDDPSFGLSNLGLRCIRAYP